MLDDNTTEALLPPATSSDTPPPLLLEGTPLAPIATVTEQLLNDDDCMLILANATLLACTAPPPPLAVPGGTDVELVKTEHAVKLELKMNNVRLNPANFSAWGGRRVKSENVDTWGECRTDKAPPCTEEVPRDGPAVNETALHFVKKLPVIAIRQPCMVVVPKDVSGVENPLYTNAPATMARAPPIACSSITSILNRRANNHRAQRTLEPAEVPAFETSEQNSLVRVFAFEKDNLVLETHFFRSMSRPGCQRCGCY